MKRKEWLESVLYAFIAFLFFYFVLWPFEVSGASMEDTLFSGDRIVVSRVLGVGRGDIIVCNITESGKKIRLVKRVVALPDEHVEIKDGGVFVDGVLSAEPYIKDESTFGAADISLAAGEYFVLGDNRSVSEDSRMVGPIKKGDIIGKVVARWFPFTQFEILL